MSRHYLDCCASELADIQRQDLLDFLRLSEGRILVSETIAAIQPLLVTITNAELAASHGADLLLLNVFDAEGTGDCGLAARDASAPWPILMTLSAMVRISC